MFLCTFYHYCRSILLEVGGPQRICPRTCLGLANLEHPSLQMWTCSTQTSYLDFLPYILYKSNRLGALCKFWSYPMEEIRGILSPKPFLWPIKVNTSLFTDIYASTLYRTSIYCKFQLLPPKPLEEDSHPATTL